VIDRIPKQLIRETGFLFDTIKTAMENQGYNNWTGCVYEHFVRAGEVIIAKNLKHYQAAERLQNEYINTRKFIYLPLIITELERYYKNKKVTYEETVIRVMEKLKKMK
jgi:hypothetical protein